MKMQAAVGSGQLALSNNVAVKNYSGRQAQQTNHWQPATDN